MRAALRTAAAVATELFGRGSTISIGLVLSPLMQTKVEVKPAA
jgi:hypothetical protein